MVPPAAPIKLPRSYHDLPFEQIKITHHPESSAEPTPVVILTLYRPNKNNAFTDTMMSELEQAYAILSVDPRVKAIVMTGSGRMFCAGADLEIGLKTQEGEKEIEHRDGGGRAALSIHHCTKPVIGAIQGAAVGVGITMVLPCTIRVALRSAKIGFVFARRGIAMEGASSYFLPRLIGYGNALHVVSTGSVYRADDPKLQGLFTEFADTAEEVQKRAIQLADEIVHNCSTVGVYMMREMMWRGKDSAEEQHLLDSRVLSGLRGKPDNDEGIASFMEKRQAKFTGTVENNAPQVYPWWNQVDVRPYPEVQGKEGAKPKL